MDGFQRRREQKKMNILETALDLFMRNGILGVSIAQISKKANVSQVTIYNYFGSKKDLIHEVAIYYVDKVWIENEKLRQSDMPFPEKIKQMIFYKKEAADNIHEEFYLDAMKEYTVFSEYIENFYTEKVYPFLIEFLNEGKKQGYVDPNLSNEAILFYIQMLKESIQRKEVYENILPMTEDITKLLFYGILGNKGDERG